MDTSASPAPARSHRSWYLDTRTADQLAAAVDDIHHATRRPKHEVLAAAVTVALEHRDDIEARLKKDSAA